MKKNDLAEIKKANVTSLKERAVKLKNEVSDLYLEKAGGKLKNLKVIQNKRDDLARILTVLRQKEMIEKLEKTDEK